MNLDRFFPAKIIKVELSIKYTFGFDLFTACETLQFYTCTSIGEVILKIHLTQDEQIKVTVYANQEKSVQYTFTLMISFVFSS